MYDLNLLYELVVLVTIPEYREFYPTTRFGYRNGRPTRAEHQAYLYRARYESPLLLELVTSPIALVAAGPVLIRAWIAAADELIDFIDKLHDRSDRRREEKEERVLRSLERRKRLQELTQADEVSSEPRDQLDVQIREALADIDGSRDDLHKALMAHGAEATYEAMQRRISNNAVRPRQLELFAAFDVADDGEEAGSADELR